jgi:hypothetical protein
MRLPLAPFKVWPQLALVWDPSCSPTGIVSQMGFFSLSLGPLAIEIDGREYVKWMTGVILPEARSMAAGFPDPDPEGVKLNYGPFDECTCEPSSGIWHDEKCPQARS